MIEQLPFLSLLETDFRSQLEKCAQPITINDGSSITVQYDLGHYFYFLIEGSVTFLLKLDNEHEALEVGKTSVSITPIGWSGFREPYRYATSVIADSETQLIRWSHRDLQSLLFTYPKSGAIFLREVLFRSRHLLNQTREKLSEQYLYENHDFLNLTPEPDVPSVQSADGLEVLKKSPFFEVFNEDELIELLTLSHTKEYSRGQKIYEVNDPSSNLDVLVDGRVALIYAQTESSKKMDKRVVSTVGYLTGSACFSTSGKYTATSVALTNTLILRIQYEKLLTYLDSNAHLAVRFYLRLLWYVSNGLRTARAKLIGIKYDGEIQAVKFLIEQKCTQLNVLSDLHKVPHLLSNTHTLGDGIGVLKRLGASNHVLEKGIANSGLELLTEVVREYHFFKGLANIYDSVKSADYQLSTKQVRALCAMQCMQLFNDVGYVLSGIENLPDEPAIFIYNHLKNHEYNTLPNNFQLTLDSHFISSMILFKHYGDAGIRVVRIPRGEEYGHQNYYGRQGHIPVYTKDSGAYDDSKESRKRRLDEFFESASHYLEQGTSIMLAPEGQSNSTNSSPSAFKSGAFRLASYMKKEPWIVPVAVANFDRRLNHSTYSAVVKQPFKISERVKNPNDKGEMSAFLKKYQVEYKEYVQEAIELAEQKNKQGLKEII